MCLTKRERLDRIIRALEEAGPFVDGETARMNLEEIMRGVEDACSGVPESPDPVNSPSDGRMYPPDDSFERQRPAPSVRQFNQTRHRTLIGDNGALLIRLSTGEVEIDLPGADGRTIANLVEEVST